MGGQTWDSRHADRQLSPAGRTSGSLQYGGPFRKKAMQTDYSRNIFLMNSIATIDCVTININVLVQSSWFCKVVYPWLSHSIVVSSLLLIFVQISE